MLMRSFARRENSKGWQEGLARLAEPHRLARLAITTALAGSVLFLGGFESGGIHFGGVSGTGKTTISIFALSVDGDPMNPGPCVMAWDGTFVGFEIGLFYRNDACAVIDEAGKTSDLQIGEKIYLLAGGKGRERGTRELTLRETLMWRISIVSTGEFLLENKMAEIEAAGKKRARGGQVSRILDVEARGVETMEFVLGTSKNRDTDRLVEKRRKDPFDGENIDSAALVDDIKEQARDNYGVARPAYVQALLDHEVDYAFLRGRVAEFIAKYKPEKAHSQVQRAAERFGVISVAGELAIEYGILPWAAGSSESAAAWAFKQWLDRRGPGRTRSGKPSLRSARSSSVTATVVLILLWRPSASSPPLISTVIARRFVTVIGCRACGSCFPRCFAMSSVAGSTICRLLRLFTSMACSNAVKGG